MQSKSNDASIPLTNEEKKILDDYIVREEKSNSAIIFKKHSQAEVEAVIKILFSKGQKHLINFLKRFPRTNGNASYNFISYLISPLDIQKKVFNEIKMKYAVQPVSEEFRKFFVKDEDLKDLSNVLIRQHRELLNTRINDSKRRPNFKNREKLENHVLSDLECFNKLIDTVSIILHVPPRFFLPRIINSFNENINDEKTVFDYILQIRRYIKGNGYDRLNDILTAASSKKYNFRIITLIISPEEELRKFIYDCLYDPTKSPPFFTAKYDPEFIIMIKENIECIKNDIKRTDFKDLSEKIKATEKARSDTRTETYLAPMRPCSLPVVYNINSSASASHSMNLSSELNLFNADHICTSVNSTEKLGIYPTAMQPALLLCDSDAEITDLGCLELIKIIEKITGVKANPFLSLLIRRCNENRNDENEVINYILRIRNFVKDTGYPALEKLLGATNSKSYKYKLVTLLVCSEPILKKFINKCLSSNFSKFPQLNLNNYDLQILQMLKENISALKENLPTVDFESLSKKIESAEKGHSAPHTKIHSPTQKILSNDEEIFSQSSEEYLAYLLNNDFQTRKNNIDNIIALIIYFRDDLLALEKEYLLDNFLAREIFSEEGDEAFLRKIITSMEALFLLLNILSNTKPLQLRFNIYKNRLQDSFHIQDIISNALVEDQTQLKKFLKNEEDLPLSLVHSYAENISNIPKISNPENSVSQLGIFTTPPLQNWMDLSEEPNLILDTDLRAVENPNTIDALPPEHKNKKRKVDSDTFPENQPSTKKKKMTSSINASSFFNDKPINNNASINHPSGNVISQLSLFTAPLQPTIEETDSVSSSYFSNWEKSTKDEEMAQENLEEIKNILGS